MRMTKILIVGTGNMGSAVARALEKRNDTEVYVTNRTRAKAERTAEGTGMKVLDKAGDMKNADVVILAVKPHMIEAVAAEVSALDAALYISCSRRRSGISQALSGKEQRCEVYAEHCGSCRCIGHGRHVHR